MFLTKISFALQDLWQSSTCRGYKLKLLLMNKLDSPSPSLISLKKTTTSTWVLTGECGLWC